MRILFPKNKKPACKAISSAANYAQHVASGLKLPTKAIMCPISSLVKYVTSHGKYKQYNCGAEIYVEQGKNFCYVNNTSYGAPAMGMTLELLIALGVKEIIFLGLAGSLQEEVQPADITLCDEALCDDGTSPCYTNKETSKPSKELFTKLQKQLTADKQNFHIGRNWTTDGIFRETKEEIKHYQKHNVLTVEMETAAFYAICKARHIKGMAAYAISDKLYEYKWETHFGERSVHRVLEVLFDSAKKVLK